MFLTLLRKKKMKTVNATVYIGDAWQHAVVYSNEAIEILQKLASNKNVRNGI